MSYTTNASTNIGSGHQFVGAQSGAHSAIDVEAEAVNQPAGSVFEQYGEVVRQFGKALEAPDNGLDPDTDAAAELILKRAEKELREKARPEKLRATAELMRGIAISAAGSAAWVAMLPGIEHLIKLLGS